MLPGVWGSARIAMIPTPDPLRLSRLVAVQSAAYQPRQSVCRRRAPVKVRSLSSLLFRLITKSSNQASQLVAGAASVVASVIRILEIVRPWGGRCDPLLSGSAGAQLHRSRQRLDATDLRGLEVPHGETEIRVLPGIHGAGNRGTEPSG